MTAHRTNKLMRRPSLSIQAFCSPRGTFRGEKARRGSEAGLRFPTCGD
jgi:hypothetical protein